jgi:hypothetical protein
MTQAQLTNTPLISNDLEADLQEAPIRTEVGGTLIPTDSTIQPQPADKPFISEPLTWKQICGRYPDEWVCLVEIDRPEENNFAFHTARVVGHGKGRRDPLVQARAFRDQYDGMGHYFTGRVQPLLRGAPYSVGEEATGIDIAAASMGIAELSETRFISEPLTWKQICERYPEEWVCLVEIDAFNDNDFGFRSARVVGHGKDPRDPYLQGRPLREQYPERGHYFTGLARGPFPRFCR